MKLFTCIVSTGINYIPKGYIVRCETIHHFVTEITDRSMGSLVYLQFTLFTHHEQATSCN